MTHNDRVNDLANGDVGVVVHGDGVRWVAMSGTGGLRLLAPARLGEWEPWWAMTIHKSQGSEFAHAVVSLPTVDSPILTRELLYTAVTRAKPEVTVVASEEILRLAVDPARGPGLGPARPPLGTRLTACRRRRRSVPPAQGVVRLDRVSVAGSPSSSTSSSSSNRSASESRTRLEGEGELADALVVQLVPGAVHPLEDPDVPVGHPEAGRVAAKLTSMMAVPPSKS